MPPSKSAIWILPYHRIETGRQSAKGRLRIVEHCQGIVLWFLAFLEISQLSYTAKLLLLVLTADRTVDRVLHKWIPQQMSATMASLQKV